MSRLAKTPVRVALVAALALFVAQACNAYSVLTHEEIVDLLWKDHIRLLLLQRFPDTSEEQLREAHAYAYGGSVIQDMGYYPFGNKNFSNLVHYVRSGDFVMTLLRDSTDVNEYAFALGALAHYVSDISGHPAINRAVAQDYPKLSARYGKLVTYGENPKAHLRVEFGFDVTQVAKNRYAPDAYHDFIGFMVSKPLLERAFQETYGLDLKSLFLSEDLAIGTYRRSVSRIIPEMTRVALLSKRTDIVRETPNFSKKKFLYRISRSDFEKEWGRDYHKPGLGARFMAFLFRLVPKVGPFKAIDFKVPTTETENLFVKSVDTTSDEYQKVLDQLRSGLLRLDNRDCDTGALTAAGEYDLADSTYADLLDRLSQQKFALLTPELKENILQFYVDRTPPSQRKKSRDRWQKSLQELDGLQAAATTEATAFSAETLPAHDLP
ncbi:MAG TPA: zinc dependent phospholipase C family protein [Terriglobales bacterium]|nr:zinc dependent phospholipase C family protein [Terriglobales bacterium]